MRIRWLRLFLATIASEVLAVLMLVLLVLLFGPSDATEAEAFAARLGDWVGPIGGALATFLFALWVARPLGNEIVLHGFLLGLFVALLDAAILVGSGADFRILFVLSGVGRIAAGTLGGLLAAGRRTQSAERQPTTNRL